MYRDECTTEKVLTFFSSYVCSQSSNLNPQFWVDSDHFHLFCFHAVVSKYGHINYSAFNNSCIADDLIWYFVFNFYLFESRNTISRTRSKHFLLKNCQCMLKKTRPWRICTPSEPAFIATNYMSDILPTKMKQWCFPSVAHVASYRSHM